MAVLGGMRYLMSEVHLYEVMSLIQAHNVRPYGRTQHRALVWPWGGRLFLMREVPLYGAPCMHPHQSCVWEGPYRGYSKLRTRTAARKVLCS